MRDIQTQQLADIGFEVFDGDDAYIQTQMADPEAIAQILSGIPYSIEECPDENWNATWEEEHPVMELPNGIRIIPHCAFGAGHHQTTGMMLSGIETILPSLREKRVLDMGCGTGVLAIMAAQLGATDVLAVDIDEKATANTEENAHENGVQLRILTQSTVPQGEYDLILANIHRNILLAQMADYARYLSQDGRLLLSGFYADDIPALSEEAKQHGLQVLDQQSADEWCMLILAHAH